nr:MAG TPA: endonuclease-like protein [Caudoviricetes sp.]
MSKREEVCIYCKKVFNPHKSEKYCRGIHYKKCEICNKEFSFIGNKERRTCSKECNYKLVQLSIKKKLEKEGLVNVFQRKSVKEKIKNTQVRRYGAIGYQSSYFKNAMLNRYGIKNGGASKQAQENIAKTNLERRGVKSNFQDKKNIEQSKKTKLERYGTLAVNQEKATKTKIAHYGKDFGKIIAQKGIETKKKNGQPIGFGLTYKKTMLERYGVENPWNISYIREKSSKNNGHTISQINKRFAEKLKNIGLKVELEKNRLDLLIEDKLFVEINPTFSHNTTQSYSYATHKTKKNNPISKAYHQDKAIYLKQKGLNVIFIFDWMDEDKIIDIILAKVKKCSNKISASKCKIKEINQIQANKFFKKYHLQGAAKMQTFCLGLFYKDELIQVQTYGPSRFDKKIEWEAIRLATKKDWVIIGGVEKGWKYFLKEKNPKSVVSYNSLNISDGAADKIIGFEKSLILKPSGKWCLLNPKLKRKGFPEFLDSNSVRKQGIDRLLPDYSNIYNKPYNKNDKSTWNESILELLGYREVYDCGIIKRVWRKNDN